MKTPLSSMLLVVFASFIGSFGAVLLKAGAGKLRWHWHALAFNWQLLLGICFFVASSMFFVAGVRNGELTILYPLVSLGYVWTLLWSKIFFHEAFSRNKFIGLALILTGIVFLGLGNK